MDMHHRFWTGIALVAALASGAPASAQECGIHSLGGSTRFSDPIDSIVALQSMFKRQWSEISRLLAEARWAGDPDDLRDAVARGRVTTQRFSPGTRVEWMAMRSKGAAHLVRNDCLSGSKAYEAFTFDVESNGRRWYFSVPKICGNLALLGSDPLSEPRRAAAAAAAAEVPPAAVAAAAAEASDMYVSPTPPWSAEIFAGYFFPEEMDEDLTFGTRFGYRGAWNWGWMIGFSWFDVADSQGFSGQPVDADVIHVDFSAVFYPVDDYNFSFFFGPGFASGNIDAPGTTTDFSDDAFTFHVGVGYEFDFTRAFYIKPDLRMRYYELEGWGREGGRESQLTYEAAVALGWRFGS